MACFVIEHLKFELGELSQTLSIDQNEFAFRHVFHWVTFTQTLTRFQLNLKKQTNLNLT